MRGEKTRSPVYLPPSWVDEEGRLCYSAHVLESIPEESEPPSSVTSRYSSFHREQGEPLSSERADEERALAFSNGRDHQGRAEGCASAVLLSQEGESASACGLPPALDHQTTSADFEFAPDGFGGREKRETENAEWQREQADHGGPDAGAGEGRVLAFRGPRLPSSVVADGPNSCSLRAGSEGLQNALREPSGSSESSATAEPFEVPGLLPSWPLSDKRDVCLSLLRAVSREELRACGDEESYSGETAISVQSEGGLASLLSTDFPAPPVASLSVPELHAEASNAKRLLASSVGEPSMFPLLSPTAGSQSHLRASPPPSPTRSGFPHRLSAERDERGLAGSLETAVSPAVSSAHSDAGSRLDKPRAVRMPPALSGGERPVSRKPDAERDTRREKRETAGGACAALENAPKGASEQNGWDLVDSSHFSSSPGVLWLSSSLPFSVWVAIRFGNLSLFLDFQDVLALSGASLLLRLLLCGSLPSPLACSCGGGEKDGDTASEKKGKIFQSIFSPDEPGGCGGEASPPKGRRQGGGRGTEKDGGSEVWRCNSARRSEKGEEGKPRGRLAGSYLRKEEEMRREWSQFMDFARKRKAEKAGEKARASRQKDDSVALPTGVFSHIRVTSSWAKLDEKFVREIFKRATQLSVLEISVRQDRFESPFSACRRGATMQSDSCPSFPAPSVGPPALCSCRSSAFPWGPERRLMACLERAFSAFVENRQTLESFSLHIEGEDAGSPFSCFPVSRLSSSLAPFWPPSFLQTTSSSLSASLSVCCQSHLGDLWKTPDVEASGLLFPRLRTFSSRGSFGSLLLLFRSLHTCRHSDVYSVRSPGLEQGGARAQRREEEGREGCEEEAGDGDETVSFLGFFRSWLTGKEGNSIKTKDCVPGRKRDETHRTLREETTGRMYFETAAPRLVCLEISDRSAWFDLSLLLPFLSSQKPQSAFQGEEHSPSFSSSTSSSWGSSCSSAKRKERKAGPTGLEWEALSFLRDLAPGLFHFLGSLIRSSHASLHALTLDFAPPLLFRQGGCFSPPQPCSPLFAPSSSPLYSVRSAETPAKRRTSEDGKGSPFFENCSPLSSVLLLSDQLFASLFASSCPSSLFLSDAAAGRVPGGESREEEERAGRRGTQRKEEGACERRQERGERGENTGFGRSMHLTQTSSQGAEARFSFGGCEKASEGDASYLSAYLWLLSLIFPTFLSDSSSSCTSFSFLSLVCLSLSDAVAAGKALSLACSPDMNSACSSSPHSPSPPRTSSASALPSSRRPFPLSFGLCDDQIDKTRGPTNDEVERRGREWKKKLPVLEEITFTSPFCLLDLEHMERDFQRKPRTQRVEGDCPTSSSGLKRTQQAPCSSSSSSLSAFSTPPPPPGSCVTCSSSVAVEFLCEMLRVWLGDMKRRGPSTGNGDICRRHRVCCASLVLLDPFTRLSSSAVQQFLQLAAPSLCHLVIRFPSSQRVSLLVSRENVCLLSSPSFSSPSSSSLSFPLCSCSPSHSSRSPETVAPPQEPRQRECRPEEERGREKRGGRVSPFGSAAREGDRRDGAAKLASPHFAFVNLRSLQVVNFNPLLHHMLSEATFAWGRCESSLRPSTSLSCPPPHTPTPSSPMALCLLWEDEGEEEWSREEAAIAAVNGDRGETGDRIDSDHGEATDFSVRRRTSSSRFSDSWGRRGRRPRPDERERSEANNWEYKKALQEYLAVCDTLRRHRRFGTELIHSFISKLPEFSLILPPSGVQTARTLALLFSPSTSSLFSVEVSRSRTTGLVLPLFMAVKTATAFRPRIRGTCASPPRNGKDAGGSTPSLPQPSAPREAPAVSSVSSVCHSPSRSCRSVRLSEHVGSEGEGCSFFVSSPELERLVGVLKLLTATALIEHGFLFPLDSPDFVFERERRTLRDARAGLDDADQDLQERKKRGSWDFLPAVSFTRASATDAGEKHRVQAANSDATLPHTLGWPAPILETWRQRVSRSFSFLSFSEPDTSPPKGEPGAAGRRRFGWKSPEGDETAGQNRDGSEVGYEGEETERQVPSTGRRERRDLSPSGSEVPFSMRLGSLSLASSLEVPAVVSRSSAEHEERSDGTDFHAPDRKRRSRVSLRLYDKANNPNSTTPLIRTSSSSTTWVQRFVVPFCSPSSPVSSPLSPSHSSFSPSSSFSFSSSSSSSVGGCDERGIERGWERDTRRNFSRGLSRNVECMRQFKKQEIGLKPTEASLRFLHQQLDGVGWEGPPQRERFLEAAQPFGPEAEQSRRVDAEGGSAREKSGAPGRHSPHVPAPRRRTLLEQRLEKAELLLWRQERGQRASGVAENEKQQRGVRPAETAETAEAAEAAEAEGEEGGSRMHSLLSSPRTERLPCNLQKETKGREAKRLRGKERRCEPGELLPSNSVASDRRRHSFSIDKSEFSLNLRSVQRLAASLSGAFSDVRRSASTFLSEQHTDKDREDELARRDKREGDREDGRTEDRKEDREEESEGERKDKEEQRRRDAGRFTSKWRSFFVLPGREKEEERRCLEMGRSSNSPRVRLKKRGRLLNRLHPYCSIETLELLFIPPALPSAFAPSSSSSPCFCSSRFRASCSCFSPSYSCCSCSSLSWSSPYRVSLAYARNETRALCRRLFASHSLYRTALIQIFRFTLPRLRVFHLALASHLSSSPSSSASSPSSSFSSALLPAFSERRGSAETRHAGPERRACLSPPSSFSACRPASCACAEEDWHWRLQRAARDAEDDRHLRSVFRALGFAGQEAETSEDWVSRSAPQSGDLCPPQHLRDEADSPHSSRVCLFLDRGPRGRESPASLSVFLFSVHSLAVFVRIQPPALRLSASAEEAPMSPSSTVPESLPASVHPSPRAPSACSDSVASPRLLRVSSLSAHRLGRLPSSVSLAYSAFAPELISGAISRSSLLSRHLFPLLRCSYSLFAVFEQVERSRRRLRLLLTAPGEAPNRVASQVRNAVLAAVDVVLDEVELTRNPRAEEARHPSDEETRQ
ncbi:putative AAA family domain ATPase [Toxoplasma gondii MAS]|uniref:Putative AAA family domain ATPase n=1 Tax=Toxoplasma gondii MAS TaxID=943118 RepID=A0A086Q5L2_TOXGO|nr:putative AAA family domain ATPase [Toxoplasma gondii MAS]